MSLLILGCGRAPRPPISVGLDIDPTSGADVLHDLEVLPLPLGDDRFDVVRADHVLEHLGRQGDWRFWFALWSEFWRVMAPGGIFRGTVPSIKSVWALGDPGHSRIVTAEQFLYLSQPFYAHCVGSTKATDYRHVYKADFSVVETADDGEELRFELLCHKPARS